MRHLTHSVGILLVSAVSLHAQRKPPSPVKADSFLVDAVLTVVLQQIPNQLAWAARARKVRRWSIVVPLHDAVWRRAQVGLYRMLFAIPAPPSDSSVPYLHVVSVAGADSALMFEIETGQLTWCAHGSFWLVSSLSGRIRATRGYSRDWNAQLDGPWIAADPGMCDTA